MVGAGIFISGGLPCPSEDLFMYFVSHCSTNLNLQFKTIKLYPCGIRHAYIEHGLGDPFILPGNLPMLQLQQVLRGIKNINLNFVNLVFQSPTRFCLNSLLSWIEASLASTSWNPPVALVSDFYVVVNSPHQLQNLTILLVWPDWTYYLITYMRPGNWTSPGFTIFKNGPFSTGYHH